MSASTSPDYRDFDPRHYWRVIRNRLWIIVTICVIVFVTTIIATAKVQPVYQATLQLLIEKDNPNVVSIEEVVQVDTARDYYQTQYKILQSRSLASRVIHALKLHNHPEFAPDDKKPGVMQSMSQSLLASLQGWLSQPGEIEGSAALEPDMSAPGPNPNADLVDDFLGRLEVAPIRNSRLVNLRFEAHDPRLAADITNALARLYIDQNLEMRFSATREAMDWLNNRVGEMRRKVEASEVALQLYKEKEDIISLEERQNVVVQQLADLNSILTTTKTERIGIETLYNELQRFSQQPDMIESMPAVVDNPLIQNLKNNYANLQQTLSQLGQKYGPKHPRIIQLRSQMQTTQAKINTEVQKIARGIKTQYEVAKAREGSLRRAFGQQKIEAQKLNKKAIQYGTLKREVESNKQLYDILLTRMKETGVSSELKSNNIHIIDRAEVPLIPIKPRLKLNLLLASTFGLMLGIGLVFLLDYLDNTLKTPEEVTELLGLPVLGAIERFKLRKANENDTPIGLLTIQNPISRGAEEFKMLRTNLLLSYTEMPHKVFLVTSPHPKDGKSTISGNLAIVMAQTERRVLLIDADLRNPALHKTFDTSDSSGLSELLLTENYEGILEIAEGNIMFLPAGASPPNPSEMLGSERMKRFIEFARDHYDIIIIDSPPVLAISDALTLLPMVDGAIVVLHAGSTPRDHARRTIELLDGGDRQEGISRSNKVLGAVVNFLDARQGSSYGYYGYYSYYYSRRNKSVR